MPDYILIAAIFILTALAGAVMCFFGRLSFRVVSSLILLIVGLFTCLLLLDTIPKLALMYKVIASFAAGTALGIFVWFVPMAAKFIFGVLLGVLAALLLFLDLPQLSTILLPVVMFPLAIGLGVVNIIYKRVPLIVVTAYLGAGLTTCCILIAIICFSGNIDSFYGVYKSGILLIVQKAPLVSLVLFVIGTGGMLMQILFFKNHEWFSGKKTPFDLPQ